MKTLFLFLFISLLSTYIVKPKNIKEVWLRAFQIPLLSFVIYWINISFCMSAYYVGRGIVEAFLPIIVSGIFIYFQLKAKLKNDNKVKLPIVLIVFITISLIVSMMQDAIVTKNQIAMEKYINEMVE